MNEFTEHFLELVSDPAHLAFEVFTTLVLEVVILGLLWPLIQRRIRREHRIIDEEHGVDHDVETAHVSAITLESLVRRIARLEAEVQDLTGRAP